jgi:hypothetical protein
MRIGAMSTGNARFGDSTDGSSGYTGFYIHEGKLIDGPSGYTSCYLHGQHIYGPKENLPWRE